MSGNTNLARLLNLRMNAAAAALLLRRKNKNKRKRDVWVRNVFLDREKDGDYYNLVPKLRLAWELRQDPLFVETFRVTPRQLDYLLSLVGPIILKKTTHMRATISPAERLCITMRFLATGDLYRSISLAYRVGKSTVVGIVPDTCQAIWTVLQPIFLSPPSKSAMLEIAKDFQFLWNFPNCIGAIDGKHVVLQAPPNGGSVFFNYKGTHSIVLMAACDAKYRFLHVDIGNYGRISDGGVFGASALGQAINSEDFFPKPVLVPEHEVLPFVFVTDDAFPLKVNLMKPYSGNNLEREMRIFNYRLSRARRCIENSFGIMCARWRVLRKEMSLSPENAVLVVQAVACLHNLLMSKDGELRTRQYCPHGFSDYSDCVGNILDGEWRRQGLGTGLMNVRHQGSNMFRKTAANVRTSFLRYFNGKGSVDWQHKLT